MALGEKDRVLCQLKNGAKCALGQDVWLFTIRGKRYQTGVNGAGLFCEGKQIKDALGFFIPMPRRAGKPTQGELRAARRKFMSCIDFDEFLHVGVNYG